MLVLLVKTTSNEKLLSNRKNAGVFFALTEVESTAGASKDEQVDDDVDELGQRRLRVRAPEQRHQLRLCPVSRRRARRGDDDRD